MRRLEKRGSNWTMSHQIQHRIKIQKLKSPVASDLESKGHHMPLIPLQDGDFLEKLLLIPIAHERLLGSLVKRGLWFSGSKQA